MSAQIKSADRVRDRGEVFTAQREVDAMLNALPAELFANPDSTFLEPTCGQGVFLAEVLRRKLRFCSTYVETLRALSSLYGIDIAEDNVREAQDTLVELATTHLGRICPWMNEWDAHEAASIIRRNVQVGDSLNNDVYGVEWRWRREDTGEWRTQPRRTVIWKAAQPTPKKPDRSGVVEQLFLFGGDDQ